MATFHLPLPKLDAQQRYTVNEAVNYLRISRAQFYEDVNAGLIRVIKHGSRTFVPGTEIARLSRVEDVQGSGDGK